MITSVTVVCSEYYKLFVHYLTLKEYWTATFMLRWLTFFT